MVDPKRTLQLSKLQAQGKSAHKDGYFGSAVMNQHPLPTYMNTPSDLMQMNAGVVPGGEEEEEEEDPYYGPYG